MFAWQSVPNGTIDLPGLQVNPLPGLPHFTSKFDLTLSLQDAGDKIVSIIHVRSQGSRSGIAWEHRWGYVGSLRDGRWLELRAYYDPTKALEAVGVSE